jgi:UDP:flavonoid glycosyltransferase YjiC (YdhE family)
MARVLLTWELGIGLGHLLNLQPLAREFAARGHEVFFAGRDLSQAKRAFVDSRIKILAAPWKCRLTNKVEPVVSFADLLFNIGFGDQDALLAHVIAWRNLFKLINPDFIVCDHSPTALLAAFGQSLPLATVGTGFFCPIDETPMRLLRTVKPEMESTVRNRESQLLEIMNSVLQSCSAPRLERVTHLYYQPDTKHFLLTFPELDHYSGRPDGDYRGFCPIEFVGQPFAPPANGPCLFAYLKPFPALADFVKLLANSRHRAVIYTDGWSDAERNRYRCDTLYFADGPVNIYQAAAGCAAALTNANAGTCAAMLLAGKPLVNVPTQLEQLLFSRATDRLGVSITTHEADASGILQAVERIMVNKSYAEDAMSFAARHQDEAKHDVARKIVDDLEELIASR